MPAIVVHGDLAVFMRSFGVADVVVAPGTMIASALPKAGAAVCVVGDEASVMVAGCAYTTPTHVIPGVGMLSIESLISSQQAQKLKSGGKPVILAEGKFNAKFQVLVPAQQPAAPSPIPDATPSYSGKGEFQSSNQQRAKGS